VISAPYDSAECRQRQMDKKLGQLVLLTVASALLSCAALIYEQLLATIIFGALTCTISFTALALLRAPR